LVLLKYFQVVIPQAKKDSFGFRMDRIPPERSWFRSMPIGQFLVTNYPVSQPCQVSSLQAYTLGAGEENLTGCRAPDNPIPKSLHFTNLLQNRKHPNFSPIPPTMWQMNSRWKLRLPISRRVWLLPEMSIPTGIGKVNEFDLSAFRNWFCGNTFNW
jgi:hypothetical protein